LKADDLTPEQQKRFIITDNASFGAWNYDVLANEWEVADLEAWGVDLPDWDYSGSNKEIDTDFENETYFFKLDYSEGEYLKLKEMIQQTGKTPEAIFYEALVPVQMES
jgi:hypothetical protein